MTSKEKNCLNNKLECVPLSWDTEFFGISSAKITLSTELSNSDISFLKHCSHMYEFITIVNLHNNNENLILLGQKTPAFLTDINVQFEKEIKPSDFHASQIDISNNFQRNNDILAISRNSFLFSRFFNDPFLVKEKSVNVYVHWVESSFQKENKYFAVYQVENKILGYLLFSISHEEKSIIIELIAIDENCKGMGIGKKLVHYAEKYGYENGISKIKVGTQINNINALNFYHSCGYCIKKCNSVFHLWRTDNW